MGLAQSMASVLLEMHQWEELRHEKCSHVTQVRVFALPPSMLGVYRALVKHSRQENKALERSQTDHATQMMLQEAWRVSRQQFQICIELNPWDASFSKIHKALLEACPSDHRGNCMRMKHFSITGLQQICNTNIWKDYEFRKEQVRKELDARPDVPAVTSALPWQVCSWAHLDAKINEVLVIHGTTSDKTTQIANFGFDERLARESGLYGQGIYFTDQSCKSLQYSGVQTWQNQSSGCFIIARVILGRPMYAQGPLKYLHLGSKLGMS